MRKDKIEILKEILSLNKYFVDLKEGKFTRRSSGVEMGYLSDRGYQVITLRLRGKRYCYLLHCIVALVGGLNLEDPFVINHIDGNKTNNSISNLESITAAQNHTHAVKLGLVPISHCGEYNGRHKVNLDQVKHIKQEYSLGNITQKELGKRYGLAEKYIGAIIRGESWKKGNIVQYANRDTI